MFEELAREVAKIGGTHQFTLDVPLDDKGYYDRRCPSRACLGHFKVNFEDWSDKVRDEVVYCPFCRHDAAADQWHTSEQQEHLVSAARVEMTKMFQGALRRGVSRSRTRSVGRGPIRLSMSLTFKAGSLPPVTVAEASEAMRQDFECGGCGCRFASVGASFFCPCCGQNTADDNVDATFAAVESTVRHANRLEEALANAAGADTARDSVRQVLEDQYPRLVGAFERATQALFERKYDPTLLAGKGAIFQRIDDASALWRRVSGVGFDAFLTPQEQERLKAHFQRRHVLSHGQGIVDQRYLARSGDTSVTVGQRLVVRECDVLELLHLIRLIVDGLRGLQ